MLPIVVCDVCKRKRAEQRHHLCYEPELVINVCMDCHQKIHNHGVGRPIQNFYGGKWKSISIPSAMVDMIARIVETHDKYNSVSEFVRDSIERFPNFHKPTKEAAA